MALDSETLDQLLDSVVRFVRESHVRNGCIIIYSRHTTAAIKVNENEPLLLMRDGDYIEGAMRRGRVTHDDLRAKIRAADLSGPREVSLMILETTGDISILTTPPSGEKMTSGVRGIDR